MERNSRRSFMIAAGAGAAGALGGALVASAASAESDAEVVEAPTDVDIGFCSDMTVHHVQALAMCQRVLGRDTGDAVQAAAAEVLQTQAIEVGMMRAWLTDWGQSTATPETAMEWMGHEGMPTAMMPGLASDAEMQALSLAEGVAQGRLWLQLMRAHHVGGVAMAEAATRMASSPKVLRLANTQVMVQAFEIGQYDQLLNGEYA